jgi:cation transporter-like permease
MKTAFGNWQTTVVGIITIVLTILVGAGKISTEQQATILEWITQLIGIIAGIVLMFFARDLKKKAKTPEEDND